MQQCLPATESLLEMDESPQLQPKLQLRLTHEDFALAVVPKDYLLPATLSDSSRRYPIRLFFHVCFLYFSGYDTYYADRRRTAVQHTLYGLVSLGRLYCHLF